MWGILGRGMWGCVICTTQFLQVLRPLSLSLRWEGTQQVKERTVESLTLSISLGEVRSTSGFLDSIHAAQFLYHFSFKTPSPGQNEFSWGHHTQGTSQVPGF